MANPKLKSGELEAVGTHPALNMKKLPKSISRSNMKKAGKLRKKLQQYVVSQQRNNQFAMGQMASFSVQLPDLTSEGKEYQQLLKDILIDDDTLSDLEEAGVINFCRTVQKLYPLKTAGDGNCLLHAVSLAIWGVHDEAMLLRRLLYITLAEDEDNKFNRRWKSERERLDQEVPEGLELSKQQWITEWDIIVQCAEDQKKMTNENELPFKPLEEIHIFVLANIIQRPIIVLSESVVKNIHGSVLGPNNFAGIYLPLLSDPAHCTKTPVILGYHMAHFTPLVNKSTSHASHKDIIREYVVPLVNKNLEPLYIHFLCSNEAKKANPLLQEYLNVCEVNWTKGNGLNFLLSARLDHNKLPPKYDLMSDFVTNLKEALAVEREQSSEEKMDMKNVISIKGSEDYPFYLVSTSQSGTTENVIKMMQKRWHLDESDKKDTGIHITERTHQKCITTSCHNKGSIEYGGQCLECFLMKTKEIGATCHQTKARITQPFEYQPSITNVRCKFKEHCKNLASTRTFPFCHEHAGGRPKLANPDDYIPSITDFQCHYPDCRYAASVNTFPYCHEHENALSDKTYKLCWQKASLPVANRKWTAVDRRDYQNYAPKHSSPDFDIHPHAADVDSVPPLHTSVINTDSALQSTCESIAMGYEKQPFKHHPHKSLPSRGKEEVSDDPPPSGSCSLDLPNGGYTRCCKVPNCRLYLPPNVGPYCTEHELLYQSSSKTCKSCHSNTAKYQGMCLACYVKAPYPEEYSSAGDTKAQTSGRMCVAPSCISEGIPELNGLCVSCYQALSEHNKMKRAKQTSLPDTPLK